MEAWRQWPLGGRNKTWFNEASEESTWLRPAFSWTAFTLKTLNQRNGDVAPAHWELCHFFTGLNLSTSSRDSQIPAQDWWQRRIGRGLGEPVSERVGTRSDCGACAQRALDWREHVRRLLPCKLAVARWGWRTGPRGGLAVNRYHPHRPGFHAPGVNERLRLPSQTIWSVADGHGVTFGLKGDELS